MFPMVKMYSSSAVTKACDKAMWFYFFGLKEIRKTELSCYITKSDCKISHQNDLQVAVKEYTVNSLYPIVQLTADWR